MRTFTVASKVTPGITLRDGMIVIGEEGRGRKQVSIPPPPGSTVEGDVVMDIPGTAAGGIVVLVKDRSGYRGDWNVCKGRPEAQYDLWSKRIDAHRPPNGDGPLAEGHTRESDGRCAVCDAIGINSPRQPAEWTVIAEGACAQGIAGHMGGGPEYLAVLAHGQSVQINRGGRLYGEPAWLLLTNQDGEAVLTDPLKDAAVRLAASKW